MEDVEKLLEAGLKSGEPVKDQSGNRSERHDRHRDRSPGKDSDARSHHSGRGHRRHRSHSRDRRRDSSRDRDRRRHRSRDRNRDFDEERDRKRRRSRSRERRDGRYRERSRDRSRRDDNNGRDRRASQGDRAEVRPPRRDDEKNGSQTSPHVDTPRRPTPPPKSSSPQLTEEEHEMRSVFVSQLSARVGDRELCQFFEQYAGKVRDAKVITDRVSRRSKGVGYVEFLELESVQKAIALTGTKLLGLPVMVQFTESEKNRQALAGATSFGTGPGDPNAYARLYVGSLNFNLTDDDLRQVFQPFGAIEYVDLHRDQVTGKSKGYAFVQFKHQQDARNAMDKMNNFQLAGRALRVEIKAQPPPSLMPSGGGGGGGSFGDDRLDDSFGGGMNQITRLELMHKLARTEQPTGLSVTDMYRPNIPTAQTRSVLLKNMFNPEDETEPGWDADLRDDVKGECHEKYGQVIAIAVEKESASGEIYITFDASASAQKAIDGLNGRWFGGRQISANFISDALVTAHGGK